MKIALTSVTVNNPVEAFTFYTEVLGFVKRLYVPEAALAIVASPEDPDGTGLLLEPSDNPIAKTFQEAVYQAGLPIIVFGSEDIQKEFQAAWSLPSPCCNSRRTSTASPSRSRPRAPAASSP